MLAARYQIICDPRWRVTRLEVELIGDDRALQLSADGQGHWLDSRAKPLPELNGTIDVDLSLTRAAAVGFRRGGSRQATPDPCAQASG